MPDLCAITVNALKPENDDQRNRAKRENYQQSEPSNWRLSLRTQRLKTSANHHEEKDGKPNVNPHIQRWHLTMRLSDAGFTSIKRRQVIQIIDPLLGSSKTLPHDRSNRLLGGDFLVGKMWRTSPL